MTGIDIFEVQDDMDDEYYLTLFSEVRSGRTLQEVVDELDSAFSTASWSKVARGKMGLNHDMRNELRRYNGERELPSAKIPAGVTRILDASGENPGVMAILPNRKLTLRFDGERASIIYPATRVVGPRSHACMRKDTFTIANEKRVEMGATWDEFMLLAVDVLGEVGA